MKTFIKNVDIILRFFIALKTNYMRMKKIITFISACLALSLYSFSQGVNFEELTLQEALNKAKMEKKLVFLDGYTSWCGPCKYMANTIFPQKEAGDFFNKHFVNVKFDMEKGEGLEIRKNFKVRAYPTFLILTPEGIEQYRIVGGGDLKNFIEKVERGLASKKALVALEKEYQSGKMQKTGMLDYAIVLSDAYENEKSKEVSEKLMKMATPKDKLTSQFWPVFSNPQMNPLSIENMQFVLNNYKQYVKNIGEKKVGDYLVGGYTGLLNQYIMGNQKDGLGTIKQQLSAANFPGKQEVVVKADLADAVQNNDMNRFLNLLENNVSFFSMNDIMTYTNVLYRLDKTDKALMARVAKLGDMFVSNVKDNPSQATFINKSFSYFRKYASIGVYWEDLTMQEALNLAKRNRSLVFVDCYTAWCGPCQNMTKNIFPQKEVGNFFNNHFINIKIDMEKGDGPEIAKKYGIRAYPTFLILRPDGSVQHKTVGGGDAKSIIERATQGLNEETSTGGMDKKYEEGNRDKDFLVSYLNKLIRNYEKEKPVQVAGALVNTLTDAEKISPDYWFIYENNDLSGLGSDNFNYLIKHEKEFNKTIGEKKVENRIMNAYSVELRPILTGRNKSVSIDDLNKMQQEAAAYKIVSKKEILSAIELSKIFLGKDVTTLMATSKKELKNLKSSDGIDLGALVLAYIGKNIQKDQEGQKEQYNALVNILLKNAKESSRKGLLQAMLIK